MLTIAFFFLIISIIRFNIWKSQLEWILLLLSLLLLLLLLLWSSSCMSLRLSSLFFYRCSLYCIGRMVIFIVCDILIILYLLIFVNCKLYIVINVLIGKKEDKVLPCGRTNFYWSSKVPMLELLIQVIR